MKQGAAVTRARWFVRWGALALFLVLYARTAYRGSDVLEWPVHQIFRIDPIAPITEFASGSVPVLPALVGAGLMVLATLLLGRFFCGWLCPLGTLLEAAGRPIRRLFGRKPSQYRRPPAYTASVTFAALLAATLAGLPLLGFFDPLSILLRSLTLSIFPTLDAAAKETFRVLLQHDVPLVTPAAEWLFEASSDTVLLFGRPAFMLAGFTALIFAGIFLLELVAPRFWCAHLCPLGAFLGIVSRFSPLGRAKAADCKSCRACSARCPTGAADTDPADKSLCIQCTRCAAGCGEGAMRLGRVKAQVAVPSARARRALLASLAVALAAAAGRKVRAEEREEDWDFLRPPGALNESEFTRRCIRCGACMRVCPRSALHPALGEAGLGGLWTPRLIPRVGYCEYRCRLCGQVCPTGAIKLLTPEEKAKWVTGIAVFDKNRCLPHRGASPCIVCEEHCPTSPKAIEFDEVEMLDSEGNPVLFKVPRIVESRCVGCGICENVCPLPGLAAVKVTREKGQENFSPYG